MLPSSVQPDHIRDNLTAAQRRLTGEEVRRIDADASAALERLPAAHPLAVLARQLRAGDDENASLLTAREREAIALVAQGRTNREIGQHLYVSEKTASVHVSNILRKLEAANRVEAAAHARRLGLV